MVQEQIPKFVETLYVSDTCTESHYSKYHEKNRGQVQVAGEIAVDMTSLVTRNKLERITEKKGKSYYHIEFDLVMIFNRRGLKYEARFQKQK